MVKSLTEKENRGENMAIPKYQYIKDELKNKIISGQFASGDKFYTEAELIAMYDVSSITVCTRLKRPCQRWLYCPPTRKGNLCGSRTQAQTCRIF